ncbi:MAG: choice-of-anchor J domain-containing protein, partial [Muribaculaceae bacterium]|nr:choice-of-anchor J domain-containing protein [Muribaculaceae bacterium]
AIGRYNGLMQLGKLDGTGVNRISNAAFKSHMMLDFESGVIDTTTVTIPEMIQAARTTEGKIKWQSRLVRINDVEFEEAGFPFTNGNTTSRTIVDAEGNEMIVYNSSYADFAYDRLPYGTGDVVGILSCYRSTWQLLLIDLASCIGFEGEGPFLEAMTPEGDGTAENPYNAAGAIEAANAGSTAEVYVKGIIVGKPDIDTSSYGNASYYIGAEDSYTQLYIYRGYGLNGAKFTSADQLEKGKEVIVKGSLTKYNNVPQLGQGNQLVMYDGQGSIPDDVEPKGDGTAADPYNAAAANAAAIAGSTAEVYVKGIIVGKPDIDTGQYGNASYYIGDADNNVTLYVYRGYGLNGAKFTSKDQLEVGKEVIIQGNLTTYNGNPQIAQGSKIIMYDGQGTLPEPTPEGLTMLAASNANGAEGWTLTGNDKWKWDSYNGNNYLNISCQNDPQTEDLYAISPVINLAEGGYTSMSFMHTAKFQDGGFKDKCHIAVREEGVEAWTILTFSGYPAAGNWTFVSSGAIDITAYAGKKIQVAFVYGAGCTDKWEINDLTFTK